MILIGGIAGDGLTFVRTEHNGAPAVNGIEIDVGEEVTGVRIVFLYGALTLHGEVKIVGGTLPDGYRFEVIAYGTDQTMPYDGTMEEVDARGRFSIENLGPGEYEVKVNPISPTGVEPSPDIRQQFSSVKKRVFVGSENQQPITLVVDLSRQEGDK